MSHRKIIFAILVISILAVSSLFVAGLTQCSFFDSFLVNLDCGDILEQKFHPIFFSFLPLLLITLILFFVRRKTFLAWAKFAVPAFPIMLGILLYTYNNAPTGGGFGLAGLVPDELFATATLPLFFAVISIGIIALKSAEFSIGLRVYIRLILKYFGLAMIILPILLALMFFIWLFTVSVLRI